VRFYRRRHCLVGPRAPASSLLSLTSPNAPPLLPSARSRPGAVPVPRNRSPRRPCPAVSPPSLPSSLFPPSPRVRGARRCPGARRGAASARGHGGLAPPLLPQPRSLRSPTPGLARSPGAAPARGQGGLACHARGRGAPPGVARLPLARSRFPLRRPRPAPGRALTRIGAAARRVPARGAPRLARPARGGPTRPACAATRRGQPTRRLGVACLRGSPVRRPQHGLPARRGAPHLLAPPGPAMARLVATARPRHGSRRPRSASAARVAPAQLLAPLLVAQDWFVGEMDCGHVRSHRIKS
jgi:hypothetical protein